MDAMPKDVESKLVGFLQEFLWALLLPLWVMVLVPLPLPIAYSHSHGCILQLQPPFLKLLKGDKLLGQNKWVGFSLIKIIL